MDRKNFTQTPSWLPQPGTRARTVTLKKLKRNLESQGLTTHEVYTGLLQLITSPRVLVERWRARGALPNEKSDWTRIESEFLSSAKKVDRDEVRVDDKTSEANNSEVSDMKNVEVLSCPPRAKTPELMDERVGGKSRSFVKTIRKVISLNLHGYEAQCINVNHKKRKSSTEISAADSSVSDEGNSNFHPALDRKDEAPIPKKPTIVEDFTCLEGTLLGDKILLDSSRVNQTEQPKSHVGCGDGEKNSKNPIPLEAPAGRKRPARKIHCCRKKSRIRRTFRQLFGNISTSSELDEEDEIVERFLGISRRKKSRNSSDSGVGLIEINSENTYVSDSEQGKSSEESTQSSSDEMEIDLGDETKNEPETVPRSMPLLDSLATTSNSIDEILADSLPDSSTSASGDSPPQADSSSPEASNTKKKLTILVSPLDIHSFDAFSPLTLEIDVPCETQTLVPTSTTAHSAEILKMPKIERNENFRENENSPKYIDISDEEEFPAVPVSSQNSQNAGIAVDTLASELPNEKLSAGTAGGAQDLSSRENEEISPCRVFENVAPVPEPEIASSDRGIPINSTGGPTAGKDQGRNVNESMTQPALSSSPSVPRIRVLLPSELGSRWCPTPLNIPSCSENVPSVPELDLSSSAPPAVLNRQLQSYGIPNVQASQGDGTTDVQTSQGNGITNVQDPGPTLLIRLLQSNDIPNAQTSQANGMPNVQRASPVSLNHQLQGNGMPNVQPSQGNGTPNRQGPSPVFLNHQLQGNGMPNVQPSQGNGTPNRQGPSPVFLNHQLQGNGMPNVQPSQGNGTPNRQGSSPVFLNHQLQGNGMPNVQPSQGNRSPNVQRASPVSLNHQLQGNGMPNVQPSQGNGTPNRQGPSPVLLNHQLQGNGMQSVQPPQGHGVRNTQPSQTFQNPSCTLVNSNGERFPGAYIPNSVKAPNPPTYSQQGCTVQNPSPQAPDYRRQTIIYKSVTSIFSYFAYLHSCIEQNETVYDPAIAKILHNNYRAKWALLRYELINLRSLTGVSDRMTLLEQLIQIYGKDFNFRPKLSTQQFMTIVCMDSLSKAHRPVPTAMNFQRPTMYGDQFAAPLRPPPPAYPPCSSPCCVPRSNVISTSQYAPSRPVPPLNPHERAFSGMTLPPAPNTPALSPAQLNLLRDQITSYNNFRVEKPEKQRRTKESPTKKTWVSPLPTLVDPMSRVSPPAHNIRSPITTPPYQEPGNISRATNQINDPRSSETAETEKRWSERLDDAMEWLAGFSDPANDYSKPDNNNNSNNNYNEQSITKMKTPTCPPTAETSIISQSTHLVQRDIPCSVQEGTTSPVQEEATHPVQEATTYPVEQEPMCSVQEATTYPVQEGTTSPIQEEATHPVQEATTYPVEQEPMCSVQEATTYPVEEEPTCSVQEETTYPVEDQTMHSVEREASPSLGENATSTVRKESMCPVGEATACCVEETMTCTVKEEMTFVIEEETPCPVNGETTCLVKEEEATYPVGEEKSLIGQATTSLVEEETNYPLKGEMSRSNNTKESDDVSSGSACEVIDVVDDDENVEGEITTDRKVSVIVLNDSTNENPAIPNDEDTETNFSILEVTSITKDIFDNLNTSKEESSTPKSPEPTSNDIETHDDSSTNSGLRNCLRCGKPSSVVCEQCYEAFYCSSECHEADWTEHHYLTCKPVPAEALALFEMSWNSQTNLPSPEDKLSTK